MGYYFLVPFLILRVLPDGEKKKGMLDSIELWNEYQMYFWVAQHVLVSPKNHYPTDAMLNYDSFPIICHYFIAFVISQNGGIWLTIALMGFEQAGKII